MVEPVPAGRRSSGLAKEFNCHTDVHSARQLVSANPAQFPTRKLCETLKVSTSGYYDWQGHPRCARAKANSVLLVLRIQEAAQYTSIAFGNRCREMGVRPCMATVGDTYDNTMAESFFASLKCELIAPQTKTEARLSVFTWIKTWRTPWRRHSGLGPMSPINFEMKEQGKQHNPATTTPTLITPDSIQEKDGDREVKCVRGNGATPAWCLVLFK